MEGRSAAVGLNRPLLAVLVGLASAVGVAPYALFAFPPRGAAAVVAVAAVAAAAMAARTLRPLLCRATERPRPGEVLLGGWNAVLFPALGALWALLVWALFYGGAFLVLWALGRFGSHITVLAARSATWASLAGFALVFLPLVKLAAGDLARHLYPDTAGTRSPYFSLLAQRRRFWGYTALFFLILAGILGFVVMLDPAKGLSAVLLSLFQLITAVQLQGLERRAGRSAGQDRALAAVDRLLSASGYDTVRSPRTGRSDIDPLISRVDLLAHSPRRTLAVEIKPAASGKAAVEWYEASQLRTAAWALERYLGGDGQRGTEVEPLLVLIGRGRASSLAGYLEDQPIRIAEIADPKLIDRILAEQDPAELRRIAQTALDAGAAPAAAAATPAEGHT